MERHLQSPESAILNLHPGGSPDGLSRSHAARLSHAR